MKKTLLVLCLSLIPYVAGAGELDILKAEIERLAESARGVVGVGVLHLESGEQLYVNGDEMFPMASTYKVPIAVKIMEHVDHGEESLDSLYTIEEGDLIATHSAMTEHLMAGSQLTLENLIAMMLQYSDNVATDVVLEKAGGAAAVTAKMRQLGLDIRVDRPTWALIMNYVGDASGNADDPATKAGYPDALAAVADRVELTQEGIEFEKDPRDHATPKAMTALLAGIWRREILSDESSEFLVDVMYGTKTGTGRLKGMLPPGTQVSHKTGTVGMTTNDVGIVKLPHDAGHVITVVFIKSSVIPDSEDREPVIAHIARAVHDYFVFSKASP